jgi:hypothetical protein
MACNFEIYHEAEAADAVFSTLLEREYGDKAGDMRYQPGAWKSPELKRAARAQRDASDRWLAEMRKAGFK